MLKKLIRPLSVFFQNHMIVPSTQIRGEMSDHDTWLPAPVAYKGMRYPPEEFLKTRR